MPPNKDFFTFYWVKLVFNKICKIQFFGGERGWNLVLFTESPRLWYAAGASPLSPAKYPTIILSKKLFKLKWRCPWHVIICIFFVGNNFIWKPIGLQYLKSMRYRSILIFKILSSDSEGAVSIGQKVSNNKMTHKHCDCTHSNRLKQPQNKGFFPLCNQTLAHLEKWHECYIQSATCVL